MSSPPQNRWLAVLPWVIAGIALFVIASLGGFGAAYFLSTGQAVATVDPAKLPTPTPSSAPSESAGPSSSPVSYVVQRGDRLSDIAAQFGVTVDAIVELNHLDNADHIEAG